MRLAITHGYLLGGSGSNVYVQNLCRALVKEGHEVHLLCQDDYPLDLDFVTSWHTADSSGTNLLGRKETKYPGTCAVYRPEIGDLLPVYVYDDYPGWRVKTFLDLSEEELENHVAKNAAALRAVLKGSGAQGVVTNHSLPGPLIARRVLEGSSTPYASIVHGSCLQYVARKSARYARVARRGLAGARRIVSPSPHGAETVIHDFPELEEKTLALTGGVDTDLFRPDALDLEAIARLEGGDGRGPAQDAALQKALEEAEGSEDLLTSLKDISNSYDARAHDADAGEKVSALLCGEGPLVVYVGKLIHSKGVHSLLAAFARLRRSTDARLLVVGFGGFREGLQAITASLSAPDAANLRRLASLGKRLEGGPEEPLEHFEVDEGLLSSAKGMAGSIRFVGPLEHAALSKLLPAADAAVVPSVFPEIFGLVAAEFAASGVVPFVAGHSGLAEAGEIVGRGLPFDLRVSTEGFEENLAAALEGYLSLPEETRLECSRKVRRNSVEDLSWTSLARDVVALF